MNDGRTVNIKPEHYGPVLNAMQRAAEERDLQLNYRGPPTAIEMERGEALKSVAESYLDQEDTDHEDLIETSQDVYQWRTEDFKLKHGLDESDINIQLEKLREEFVELKGALLFDQGDIAEELADVIFVAHLLAHMSDVDVREAFDRVSDENLEKDAQRDADGFITKD